VGQLWAISQSRYAEVIPYGETTTPSDSTLTLVSYNIGYLSGLANAALETDEEVSVSRESFDANQVKAIASLQAVNPDIVALQEVDLDARRSYQVNQVEALAQGLEMANGAIAINWDKRYVPFPYWPITQQFGRTLSGQSILSRFPIQNHERHVLDRVAGNNWIYNAFYLDRLAQVAEVVVGEANPGGDQCASGSV
jgi:endonuclease/exonuclease/phosphatase family metal-dependent hydrolase